jgi:hypothetical protein
MRKLPLLLVLLLLSILLAATSAHASLLPLGNQAAPFVAPEDEEEGEDEGEEGEDPDEEAQINRELCEWDEEFCEEEGAPQRKAKEGECLLKNASAALTANPGKRRLRLTVHYRTLKPTSVTVEASLQGPKGAVRLGTSHARFRRSGVYRDTFGLAEKQMKKALAANDFTVELRVVSAPPSCGVELTKASPRARR